MAPDDGKNRGGRRSAAKELRKARESREAYFALPEDDPKRKKKWTFEFKIYKDDSVRVGNKRRYLAAHRWDWRPSRNFMLSAMESVLYSGSNAGLSLKYLNPLHPFTFVVDNRPKNEENNGFVTGLLWAQFKRLTVHAQMMVDDFKEIDEVGSTAKIPAAEHSFEARDNVAKMH